MNEQEARMERQRMIDRSRDVPDHVKDGRTLPEQIEGDHAYRDEPPEHDPSLWASAELECLACGTRFPDAPAGERDERLRSGQVDVGHCPECDRDTPCVEPSKVTPPSPQSGFDDVIHVVLKTTHYDRGYSFTRAVAAYRDKEAAEAEAEEQSDAFSPTTVECVGLHY